MHHHLISTNEKSAAANFYSYVGWFVLYLTAFLFVRFALRGWCYSRNKTCEVFFSTDTDSMISVPLWDSLSISELGACSPTNGDCPVCVPHEPCRSSHFNSSSLADHVTEHEDGNSLHHPCKAASPFWTWHYDGWHFAYLSFVPIFDLCLQFDIKSVVK
jgi:hypothetical protein